MRLRLRQRPLLRWCDGAPALTSSHVTSPLRCSALVLRYSLHPRAHKRSSPLLAPHPSGPLPLRPPDPGARYAGTVPVNTIGGGIVRFSLHMHAPQPGEPPAALSLDFRAVGQGWRTLETYKQATYALPGYANPNAGSLGLWAVPPTQGWVLFAVRMPPQAQSGATKARIDTRQQRSSPAQAAPLAKASLRAATRPRSYCLPPRSCMSDLPPASAPETPARLSCFCGGCFRVLLGFWVLAWVSG